MEMVAFLIAGTMAGLALGWVIQELRAKGRLERMQAKHNLEKAETAGKEQETKGEMAAEHREQTAMLEGRLRESKNAQEIIETAKAQMGETFGAAAARALESTTTQFLTTADENFKKSMNEAKTDLEKRYTVFEAVIKPIAEQHEKINPNLESLLKQNRDLTMETSKLSSALGDNRQAGSWGEVQLKKVVELAHMTAYCDFNEQESVSDGAERPDLTVHLPGGHSIVVDAKASLLAFMEAQQQESAEGRKQALDRHARALRTQVDELHRKDYGKKVQGARDYVVMFVPGDQFLGAALEANPGLIEYAMSKRVAIATPSSLISLLWTAYGGWQEARLAENAEGIRKAGQDYHESMQVFMNHYTDVGRHMARTVEAYNKSIGNFDSRVMPRGRKFTTLSLGEEAEYKAIPALEAPVQETKNTQTAETGGEDG